jgi:hypothetical protein
MSQPTSPFNEMLGSGLRYVDNWVAGSLESENITEIRKRTEETGENWRGIGVVCSVVAVVDLVFSTIIGSLFGVMCGLGVGILAYEIFTCGTNAITASKEPRLFATLSRTGNPDDFDFNSLKPLFERLVDNTLIIAPVYRTVSNLDLFQHHSRNTTR